MTFCTLTDAGFEVDPTACAITPARETCCWTPPRWLIRESARPDRGVGGFRSGDPKGLLKRFCFCEQGSSLAKAKLSPEPICPIKDQNFQTKLMAEREPQRLTHQTSSGFPGHEISQESFDLLTRTPVMDTPVRN